MGEINPEKINLKDILESSSLSKDFEIVQVKELNPKYNKILHSIEEAIDEFDNSDVDFATTTQYLIRIKEKQKNDFIQEKPIEEQIPPNQDIPANFEFLLKNAQVLFDNKDYSLSRKLFAKVLNVNPKNTKAILGFTKCSEHLLDYINAEKCAEQLVAIEPTIQNYLLCVSFKFKANKDEEIIDLLAKAQELKNLNEQDYFEIFKTIGNCYTRMGDFESAEENYFKALKINPLSDKLLANLGTLEFQRKDYNKAKSYFEEATQINDQNEKAYCGLGMSLWELGQKNIAFDYFIQSLEINSDNLTGIYNIVKGAYELKKYTPAEKYLKTYLELHSTNTNIMFSLAGIYYQQTKRENCQNEIDKILILDPLHNGALELAKLMTAEQESK